jgi:hypothetical protein
MQYGISQLEGKQRYGDPRARRGTASLFKTSRLDQSPLWRQSRACVASILSQFRTRFGSILGEDMSDLAVMRPCGAKHWTRVGAMTQRDQSMNGGILLGRSSEVVNAHRGCARRSNYRAPAGSAPWDRRSRCAGPISAAQASRPRRGPRRSRRSGHAGR